MISTTFLWITFAALLQGAQTNPECWIDGIRTFPPNIPGERATAQWDSCSGGLDGPKVDITNGTSYDFWYFDSVALDGRSSFTVIFSVGLSPLARPGQDPRNLRSVQISGSFPNGTNFSKEIVTSTAIVSVGGDGSNGLWGDSGFAWSSSPDMSDYLISLDAPDGSIRGNFSLHSTAPAHYPCGPNLPGLSMEVSPGVGWSNGVPDAEVTVDVEIDGERLNFIGIGYHDKNWGEIGFRDTVRHWNWGHARMGPYSLVWLESKPNERDRYISGYVAYQGRIIFAQCQDGIEILPLEEDRDNQTTPGFPVAYRLKMDIGGKHGTLEAKLKPLQIVLGSPLFTRWVGEITGTVADSSWKGFVSGDYGLI